MLTDILVYLRGDGYRYKAIRVDDARHRFGSGKLPDFYAWTDDTAIARDGAGEPYEERDT